VGFAIETSASFGGWGGNVDWFEHSEAVGDKQDSEGKEDIRDRCLSQEAISSQIPPIVAKILLNQVKH
jgi:hypothetical protein